MISSSLDRKSYCRFLRIFILSGGACLPSRMATARKTTGISTLERVTSGSSSTCTSYLGMSRKDLCNSPRGWINAAPGLIACYYKARTRQAAPLVNAGFHQATKAVFQRQVKSGSRRAKHLLQYCQATRESNLHIRLGARAGEFDRTARVPWTALNAGLHRCDVSAAFGGH